MLQDKVAIVTGAAKYLYIDADENHVALQYLVKKGDTKVLTRKNNGTIAKLVYVYEGIEPVAPKSKRHRLINPYYFSGCYEGEKNTLVKISSKLCGTWICER